ncbi:MAG: hypothetical protein LBI96_03835 [Odoribacteraceae bacterium]|jgi:hypothetical protein|nr:hypothetical protein [Odoribacteraceae bacterium]
MKINRPKSRPVFYFVQISQIFFPKIKMLRISTLLRNYAHKKRHVFMMYSGAFAFFWQQIDEISVKSTRFPSYFSRPLRIISYILLYCIDVFSEIVIHESTVIVNDIRKSPISRKEHQQEGRGCPARNKYASGTMAQGGKNAKMEKKFQKQELLSRTVA